MSRDDRNVVLGLDRQIALLGEPFRDAAGAGVVGRRGEPEIAEALPQFGQQRGGLGDRRFGVEGIGEPAFVSGSRHELRDAQRARGTGDAGPEVAFLPDQPGQKRDRKTLCAGGGVDQPADAADERFASTRGGAFAGGKPGTAAQKHRNGRGGEDRPLRHDYPLPQVVLPSLSHPRFTCHANIARAPSHNWRAISAAGSAGARAADWAAQACIVAISSDLTAASRIACVKPRFTG